MKKTTEPQYRALIGQLLSTPDIGALDGDRVQIAKEDTDLPQRFVEWINAYERKAILEEVMKVEFSGAKEQFVASEHFTETEFYLGDNFKSLMVPKVEGPQGPSTLLVEKALRKLSDTEIIKVKGGKGKVVTSLSELRYLLFLQSKGPGGPQGALLTDGSWNRFYIEGVDGVLYQVSADWDDDRWRLSADDLGYYGLNVGRRLVSRN